MDLFLNNNSITQSAPPDFEYLAQVCFKIDYDFGIQFIAFYRVLEKLQQQYIQKLCQNLSKTSINKYGIQILCIIPYKYNRKIKMFWCYNCQQNCSMSASCTKCHSEAIQQVTIMNNPQHFKPYQISSEEHEQQSAYPLRSLDSLYRDLFSNLMGQDSFEISSAMLTRRPNSLLQFAYVVVMDNEQQKQCLTEDQINKLKQIQIQEECSICQEAEKGVGIELECSHRFHVGCIKPWLRQNNTCPCCRKQVDESF